MPGYHQIVAAVNRCGRGFEVVGDDTQILGDWVAMFRTGTPRRDEQLLLLQAVVELCQSEVATGRVSDDQLVVLADVVSLCDEAIGVMTGRIELPYS
jgi:hypothetical protein